MIELVKLGDFTWYFLGIMSLLFSLAISISICVIAYLYLSDILQKKQAIRKNYPVIGRFRYAFEHLGHFFRQYFFALDREELPFNRALRSWIYRSAKNITTNIPFGSTHTLNQPGDYIFLNALFPISDHHQPIDNRMIIGEGYVKTPYVAQSIFNISGMSYGAISSVAIRALSHGAKKAGVWLNTGEGGLSQEHLDGDCDLIFQIGTAKYGVRNSDGYFSMDKLVEVGKNEQIKMFEIKLSQGAKPGKGGILPAEKVSKEVANIRGIPQGVASISPNGHSDIRSISELLSLINDIRTATGKPVGFKLVLGESDWVTTMCDEIHKKGKNYAPDFITIDSADGGTGAAPQSLMDFVGLPIKTSLPFVYKTLEKHELKSRIKLIASGKLVNPAQVAWALAMGADFVVSARGFMFALGCIQALQCNKNTCPTGITTHDPDLQKGLDPKNKAERVKNYANNLSEELSLIAHSCGVNNPRELTINHIQMINEKGHPSPL